MSKISIDPEKEQEIINKCKKDKKLFGLLYNHYKMHILFFVKQRVTTTEDAEDITSLVFQKAFEGLDSFKWQGLSFSSWLYRIAKNTIIDHYRKSNKKEITNILNIDIATTQKGPEEIAIELDFEDKIKIILEELPAKERSIIYMKFFEGYTNKTIADLVGLTETNIGTIIHRTLNKLKNKL